MWFLFQRLAVGLGRVSINFIQKKQWTVGLVIFVISFAAWLVSLYWK